MKPIAEFIVTIDAAETELKTAVLAAFKAVDEAKVKFIDAYNVARLTMETEVASREQKLRATVAEAVEALNGDAEETEAPKASEPLSPAPPLEAPAEASATATS